MTCFQNISIASALTAWWIIFHIKGSTVAPSTSSLIWNNPDFTINRKPLNVTSCKHKVISHFYHIVQDSKIISFQELIQRFDICNSQYLQYLQLNSTILPKINNTFNTQDQTVIIDDFSKTSCSVFYSQGYIHL